MRREFKFEKRAILVGVALLVIADVALAAYGWKLAAAPRSQQDVVILSRNRDLLRADIKRAQDIRQKIPAIQKDCDQFEQSLFPAKQERCHQAKTQRVIELVFHTGMKDLEIGFVQPGF